MAEGVDYSWDRPSPLCLYANGKRFACRYLSFDTNGKNLTLPEARGLSAAGLDIVCNWEAVANAALGGYARGIAEATRAKGLAASTGQPADRPIYFSVDFDASPTQLRETILYFAGCIDVLGFNRVGVYGGYNTIDYFIRNRGCRWFWQTYAWSAGRIHAGAHLYQYRNNQIVCGAHVDLDKSLATDFGQWSFRTGDTAPIPPAGGSTPIATPWDYTGTIAGTAAEFKTLGTSLASVTTAVNNIRKL